MKRNRPPAFTTPANFPANHRAVMASRDQTGEDDPDFFPTWPWAARAGAELVRQFDPAAKSVWEPACGHGSMVHGLRDYFPSVVATDAFAYNGNLIVDFLDPLSSTLYTSVFTNRLFHVDWIITNPPFSDLEAFIEAALQRARRGVAMFLPVRTLEGVERHKLLYGEQRYDVFAPFSERVPLHKGRLQTGGSSAAFYGWFLWLKARRSKSPYPIVVPIPPGTRDRLVRPSDRAFATQVDGGPS
jgi:hypothetical protein